MTLHRFETARVDAECLVQGRTRIAVCHRERWEHDNMVFRISLWNNSSLVELSTQATPSILSFRDIDQPCGELPSRKAKPG